MNLKSVVRGVGVGTAVGTACYLLSKATSRQKHDIRKNSPPDGVCDTQDNSLR